MTLRLPNRSYDTFLTPLRPRLARDSYEYKLGEVSNEDKRSPPVKTRAIAYRLCRICSSQSHRDVAETTGLNKFIDSEGLVSCRFYRIGRFASALVRDQGVGGSNPLSPTILFQLLTFLMNALNPAHRKRPKFPVCLLSGSWQVCTDRRSVHLF